MEEVIDIGSSNLEPISLDLKRQENTPSVNFGGGIELLMNDKKKTTNIANLDLGELDDLENELNELSGNNDAETKGDSGNMFSGYFGSNNTPSVVKEDTCVLSDDIQVVKLE